MAETDVVIVSRMARGINTSAHKRCLEAKGKTIAVLGTGSDEESIYPKTNLVLSREIVEKGGCLISECKPRVPASREISLKETE